MFSDTDLVAYPGAINRTLNTIVRQVIHHIRRNRFSFKVWQKVGHDGEKDIVTSVDKSAQKMYICYLQAHFPTYGILAEEDIHPQASIDAQHPYFSIDPIDGTNAFVRQESHGIGTMLALSQGDEIVAAYVGDVLTEDVYGFYTDFSSVRWYHDYGTPCKKLVIDSQRLLASQRLLCDESPEEGSVIARLMAKKIEKGGLFQKHEIGSGGIGLAMARLWKGNVGGVLISPGYDTPWDMNPVVGILKRMGFRFIRLMRDDSISEEPTVSRTEVKYRAYELLVIHTSRYEEFLRWYESRFARKVSNSFCLGLN